MSGYGFWTDERVEQLIALNAKGISCSKIGDLIGCSRNAVIGKIHRLGLQYFGMDRSSQARRISARIKPKRSKATDRPVPVKRVPNFAFGNAAPSTPVEPYEPIHEELVIPVDERKSLMDLEPNDCRWPIGDPQHADFHFCGREKLPGVSYCAHHAHKAFVPLEVARRARKTEPVTARVKEKEDA